MKQALHTTRHPTYAEDTDHTYDDKFGLVEFLTNVSLGCNTPGTRVLSPGGLPSIERLQ